MAGTAATAVVGRLPRPPGRSAAPRRALAGPARRPRGSARSARSRRRSARPAAPPRRPADRRVASRDAWRSSAAVAPLAPLGQLRLVAGRQRLQLGQPGRLSLQVALGQVARRVAARQLVGQPVAQRDGAARDGGQLDSAARASCRAVRAAGSAASAVSSTPGSGSRSLPQLRRLPLQRPPASAGEPVALGARGQPRRLARLGDAPELPAVGVDRRRRRRSPRRRARPRADRPPARYRRAPRPGRVASTRRHLGQRPSARRRRRLSGPGGAPVTTASSPSADAQQLQRRPRDARRRRHRPATRARRRPPARSRARPRSRRPPAAPAARAAPAPPAAARRRARSPASSDAPVARRQRVQPLARSAAAVSRGAVGLARCPTAAARLARARRRGRPACSAASLDPALQRRRPRPRRRLSPRAALLGAAGQLGQPRPQVGQPGDARLDLAPNVGRLALGLGMRPAARPAQPPAPPRRRPRPRSQPALVGRLQRRHLGDVLLGGRVRLLRLGAPAVRPSRSVGLGVDPAAAPRPAPARSTARCDPLRARRPAGRATSRTRRTPGRRAPAPPARPVSSCSAAAPAPADLRHLGVDRVAAGGRRLQPRRAGSAERSRSPSSSDDEQRDPARPRSRSPAWPPGRRPSPASTAAAAGPAPRAPGRGRARARPPPGPASTRRATRRRWYLPRPAASSTKRRRSWGLASRISSTRPWPMTECISRPRPVSDSSSSTSRRRTRARLMKYSLSPSRVSRRMIETSPNSIGSVSHSLSNTSSTSQTPAGGRESVPPNSTSWPVGARSWAGRLHRHRPLQRVGDVRLAAAVGADDDRDAVLEAQLDAVGEGLETAHPERLQVHRLAASPLSRPAGPAGHAAQRLAGGCLLGRLLARPRAPAQLPALDQRRRRVAALVVGPGRLDQFIGYRGPPTCKLLLEHRLVVDVALRGVGDPFGERLDDRRQRCAPGRRRGSRRRSPPRPPRP